MDNLLPGKLALPAMASPAMARPGLAAQLGAGLARRLTVVVAPAGWGKTALLREGAGGVGQRVAWLTLDGGDNEPTRFWRYVAAALHVDLDGAADAERILAALAGSHAAPAVLVLDDYHLIETPAIHAALARFVDQRPATLGVVIASRAQPSLPLARWRVAGSLAELRADALRFSDDETARFLNDALGMGLAEEEIGALHARSEGWPAALRLAALALQGRDPATRHAAIQAWDGSQPLIAAYLADEVLRPLPPTLQRFLLDTAILDRLSGPLCDALTGRGDGGQTVERLARRDGLLVPMDDAGEEYRPLALLASFLRHQLEGSQPAHRRALHRRAARWFEARADEWGEEEALPDATDHALAAHEWDWAAQLMERARAPRPQRDPPSDAAPTWDDLRLADLCRAPEPELPLALEAALAEPLLTEREREVLALLTQRLSYRAIARQLVVTENTARWHIKNIYRKLGVSRRAQLVARARALGLLA